MGKVRSYLEKRVIKTHLIGDPDINPFISEYLGSLMFYPYPLKNKIYDEVKDVNYNLFCLENEYFKITTLPDLGGKLYSAFDKRSNKDIFYTNPVVKPQLIGCTGAWTSGGIEFNFPNRGHRPSVADHIDTMFNNYEDGSSSVTICDVDMISWQWFTVELRLYPGKAYIEEIVRLYNPNNYDDSYYFWATSAELEKKGLEYRFPFLWHMEEESRRKYIWPFAGDGPFAAEGVDLRFSDTMKPFTLPFGSEVLKDYIGIYYPDTDSGVVHVADFREVPGKKVWSWGQASAGIKWCERLTDNEDRYIELQSGAVETQNQFNMNEPHNKIEFREYWLHSNDNGPLCAASKDIIASYKIKDLSIYFSLVATDIIKDAEFYLRVDSEVVFNKKIDLNAQDNLKIEIPFKLDWMNNDINFYIKKGNDVLIRETLIDNEDALEMIDREEYISHDEIRESLFAQAFSLEQRRHYNEAVELYTKVIEDNPDYVQAYIRKANCYFKKHSYKKAQELLEKIIHRTPEDIELIYNYALSLWFNDNRYKALKYFYKVPNSSKLFAAASYFICQSYVIKGEYEKALTKLDYSIRYQPFHYQSTLLKAYILIQIDRKDEAMKGLKDYLKDDPIDYFAMYLLDEIADKEQYHDLIFSKKQNVYQLLNFFDELEDWNRCLSILKEYEKQEDISSLLVAYKYYYLDIINGSGKKDLIETVEKMLLYCVFPNHRIDLKIINSIINDSANAKYLYGLIQYRAENYEVVKQIWGELIEKDFNYSVVYRNLAYYYQTFEKDYYHAMELAEKGIDKEPFNDDFFYILFTSYRNLGLNEKIEELLQKIREFENKTEPCIRVWVDMLNYTGNFEKAVEILEKNDFNIYEHDPANLVPYPKICKETYLGLARKALQEKSYDKALDAVEHCLNMEKRHEQKFAEIYFYAGLIYEKIGDYKKALVYYHKIIAENISEDDVDNYQYYVKGINRMVKLNWIGIK